MQAYRATNLWLQYSDELIYHRFFTIAIQEAQKGPGQVVSPSKWTSVATAPPGSGYLTQSLQEGSRQLCPISGWSTVAYFICCVPPMRNIKQNGHRICDLLGVTTGHECQKVTHQRRSSMNVLRTFPKEASRFLGFPVDLGKILEGRLCVSNLRKL